MDAPDSVPLAADGKPFPNHFCLWPPKRALNDPSDWGDGLTPAEYNHLMDEQWSRIVEEALAAGKPFPVAATTASEHNGGWPVGIYPGDPIPEGVQIPVRLKHPLRQGPPGDKPDPVACPLPTTSADDPRPPIRPPPPQFEYAPDANSPIGPTPSARPRPRTRTRTRTRQRRRAAPPGSAGILPAPRFPTSPPGRGGEDRGKECHQLNHPRSQSRICAP